MKPFDRGPNYEIINLHPSWSDPPGELRRIWGMNEKSHIHADLARRHPAQVAYMVAAGDRDAKLLPEDLAQLLTGVAVRRDMQAYAALFRFYAPRLKSFLSRQGFSDIESEDLVQETMLNIWRKAESFDPAKAGVSTWVFTIARNCGIDRRRRTARIRLAPTEEGFEEVDPDPSAEARLIASENEAAIRAAMQRLPQDQADVIRMSFFAENPQSEIARSLGIPLGTVKSRVRLALQRLRIIMEDQR